MSLILPVTGNTEKTRPENFAFFPALDGLRAIAFLAVFFWHYQTMAWGWAGVNVFFVLSGFLITGILFDTRDHPHKVRNFYIRRTLRIFPLYYGIFLVLLLLAPFAHWEWSWRWIAWAAYVGNIVPHFHPYTVPGQEVFANFSLVSATHTTPLLLGHFWTLCVEEQFYLIWPWIVFWIADRRKLIWICAASLPVCLALRMLAPHVLPVWLIKEEVVAHVTIFRVDDLLLGGSLALLLRGPYAQALLRWARTLAPVVFVLLVLWFVLTPARHFLTYPYPYPASYLTWGFTVISVLSGWVILVAIQPDNILYRVLNFAPLRWMGRISYGAYVFHDIFHAYFLKQVGHLIGYVSHHSGRMASVLPAQQGRITSLVALPVTFLLAWLSFRFYEARFLNLKDRWTL